MSKRILDRLDTVTRFTGDQNLPPMRQIEEARMKEVAETNPPTETVERELYLPAADLVKVTNLAIALGRPLLLQGDPGCGKTRLAHAVAYELGLPLEVCNIKSTSRAQDLLYTYDAVNRLYDSQVKGQGAKKDIGIRNYIQIGPLGRAIARAQYGRRSVVLIDEIDKADLDFPNDLLHELDQLEFRVAEDESLHFAAPKDQLQFWPIVIITHNEEKALPAAFLRRCVYHFVGLPSDDKIKEILKLNGLEDETFNVRAIDVLNRLRKMTLTKPVGLSEFLEWAGYVKHFENATPEDFDRWVKTGELPASGAVVKARNDQTEVKNKLANPT